MFSLPGLEGTAERSQFFNFLVCFEALLGRWLEDLLKMVSPGQEDSPGRGCHRLSNSAGRSCKPNFVVCGHSSRRRVAADVHQRPTRRFRPAPRTAASCEITAIVDSKEQPDGAGQAPSSDLAPRSRFPPYLVLLRVGFTLPPALPPERCALTAPFHPYPGGGLAVQANLNEVSGGH